MSEPTETEDRSEDVAVAERESAPGDSLGVKESWRPADYYAQPPAKARFPRWVPIACGVAAIVALVAMFAIGAFLRSGGLSAFVALAIGQFQGEMKGMLDDGVDAEARERLDASLRDIRERLTNGTLDQGRVLPLLQEIQKVSGDRKVTAEEIEKLQSIADEIGSGSKAPPEPVEL